MEWLTINVNPPKLDCPIVARGEDNFGLGFKHATFEFDSSIFTEEEAANHLDSHEFTRWGDIS